MISRIASIYSGTMTRGQLIRPLLITGACSLIIAWAIHLWLSTAYLPDIAALTAKMQAAMDREDAVQAADLQRALHLAKLMPPLIDILALLPAVLVWLVGVSPWIIRRLREAGKSRHLFGAAFLSLLLPLLCYHFRAKTGSALAHMEPGEAMLLVQHTLTSSRIAAGLALLLTLIPAFAYPGAGEGTQAAE